MNEIGVDPGVDHLYALKTINEVHAEGGKVRRQPLWCFSKSEQRLPLLTNPNAGSL